MTTCLGKMRSESKRTQGSAIPLLNPWSSVPQKTWMRERTISISPNEAMTRMMVGARRSGRKNSRSIPSTKSAARAIATGRNARACHPVTSTRVRVR